LLGNPPLDRALATLRCFRKGDDAPTLAETNKRTQLYKSTLLRLLLSLERVLLVRRHEDGRDHGPEVARLNAVYAAAVSEREVVMGVLKELVGLTGESAAFYVRQGDLRRCLYRVDSPHLLRDQTREGDLLPLDRGSGGRLHRRHGPRTRQGAQGIVAGHQR
jgi:DNA-binding IclR family transcriptional regulator